MYYIKKVVVLKLYFLFIFRFVNHSCDPNCEMEQWSVNGLIRMAVFARRDILPGEEICYDYNFSLFNTDQGQECKCGARECRGVIGGKGKDFLITLKDDGVSNCLLQRIRLHLFFVQ